jgi:hypothetical protein
MKRILPLWMVIVALAPAVLCGRANSAQDTQDKYTLQVPGGLAFSDFKGYEDWHGRPAIVTEEQLELRTLKILPNPMSELRHLGIALARCVNHHVAGKQTTGNVASVAWR